MIDATDAVHIRLGWGGQQHCNTTALYSQTQANDSPNHELCAAETDGNGLMALMLMEAMASPLMATQFRSGIASIAFNVSHRSDRLRGVTRITRSVCSTKLCFRTYPMHVRHIRHVRKKAKQICARFECLTDCRLTLVVSDELSLSERHVKSLPLLLAGLHLLITGE